MVLGGEETVETLKRLLSMHRNSIACGSGSQSWNKGAGGGGRRHDTYCR